MGKVNLTQYKRPNGATEQVYCELPDEYVERATGIKLSTELLNTGMVAIYGRWPNEPVESEVLELADNGEGDKSPDKQLMKVIDKVYFRRHKK